MRSIYLALMLAVLTISPQLNTPVRADDKPTTEPSDSVASVNGMQLPTGLESDDREAVGGGERGGQDTACSTLNLIAGVVAPIVETGTTHSPSPKLIFYLSKPTNMSVRVAIREEAPKDGIGETPLKWLSDADAPREMSAGLHMIDLSICGTQLKPGVVYRWSVSIPRDLNDQSKQSATWRRIEYDPSAPSSGLFYDDVAREYEALLSQPTDAASKAQLKKLLADQKLNWVQNLTQSPPEPATLENADDN
jgi:hypothetical protein